MLLDMVQKINNRLGDMNLDTERIRSVCDGLLRDYRDRDEAIGNLTDEGDLTGEGDLRPSGVPSAS